MILVFRLACLAVMRATATCWGMQSGNWGIWLFFDSDAELNIEATTLGKPVFSRCHL